MSAEHVAIGRAAGVYDEARVLCRHHGPAHGEALQAALVYHRGGVAPCRAA